MILHGIEYQHPTSFSMRILADHVTYSFLAFMKSIFHFCLGCYCGGYSQNWRSNLSSCGPKQIFHHRVFCTLLDKKLSLSHFSKVKMRLKIQIITLVLEQSYIPSLNYIYTQKELTETRMFLLFYYDSFVNMYYGCSLVFLIYIMI